MRGARVVPGPAPQPWYGAAAIVVAVFVAACEEVSVDAPSPPFLAAITISPDSALLLDGETLQLAATARDLEGNAIEAAIEWASTNPAAATVTGTGLVRGLRIGDSRIVASAGGRTDTALIRVRALFQSVSAGVDHSCGISLSGAGYCWGAGGAGRLGTGDAKTRTGPAPVSGGLSFRQIDAGMQYTCAVTAAGRPYCWGGNRSGQLGDGSKSDSWEPVGVRGDLGLWMVAAHAVHACGAGFEGDAHCWGYEWFGELGNGSARAALTPVAVARRVRFAVVGVGLYFSCGVSEEGRAYCWGANEWGQLGRSEVDSSCANPEGGSIPCSNAPVAVAGDHVFLTLAAGTRHVCALAADGAAYCWGDNARGQLGNGSTIGAVEPVRVLGEPGFVSLAAGDSHSCGVTADGLVYCWGQNAAGELGTSATFENCGGRLCSTTPVQVSGDLRFAGVSAGGSEWGGHTCGVTTANLLYCWGRNARGQLGIGVQGGNSNTPVRVKGQPDG